MSSKAHSAEAPVLWQPSDKWIESTRIVDYLGWLARNRDLEFSHYSELFQWSVADLESFWLSICDYFELDLGGSLEPVLSSREMPRSHWFSNLQVNYAEQALRTGDQECAVIYRDESGTRLELSYSELRARVSRARSGLKILVGLRGDRVFG